VSANSSFLWHDYETFGRDPARDRPAQFAAIRTDAELQDIDDPLVWYCCQSEDYLPDPGACMVHGVMPQQANEQGMSEWQFASQIHQQMARPATCTLGYNSIRFDDEFTRHLLYRNLFDPYQREWQNGNSRWDLIDVVRLARALRPDGIEWPTLADGTPSNRLEHITDANGISHQHAHDALSDVYATIAVARLLRKAQPRLYQYAFQTRSKRHIQQLLNHHDRPALLHISGMYPNRLGNLSVVMSLCAHPDNSNGTLVFDLRHDPTALIEQPWQVIAEQMYTASADLPEGVSRIPVKTVHANRCPVLAPLKTLDDNAAKRLDLDVNQVLKHRDALLAAGDLQDKLWRSIRSRDFPVREDPELQLYGAGFIQQPDQVNMRKVQHLLANSPEQAREVEFVDPRLTTLLQRLLARHDQSLLDQHDRHEWRELCRKRLLHGADGFRSIPEYNSALDELARRGDATTEQLWALRDYVQQIADQLNVPSN